MTSVCASSFSVFCLLRLFAPPFCVSLPIAPLSFSVFLHRPPLSAFCHCLVLRVVGGVTEAILIIGFDLVENRLGARFETLSDCERKAFTGTTRRFRSVQFSSVQFSSRRYLSARESAYHLISQKLPLEQYSSVDLIDNDPVSFFQGRSSTAAPLSVDSSPLQAVDGVMSLALCLGAGSVSSSSTLQIF